MKMKTISRTWSGCFMFSHDAPGPEVDVAEQDVSWPAVCNEHWCKEADATVYLYRKSGPTLIVRFADLKEAFPELAERAWEGFQNKLRQPDPLHGSPS